MKLKHKVNKKRREEALSLRSLAKFKRKLIKSIFCLALAFSFALSNSSFLSASALNYPEAGNEPILRFTNKSALKFQKRLTVGQVEIVEFAHPVSLAHYGVSEESLNYIELDKLEPSSKGYKKFIIKAKQPGYGELTFKSGDDLIKVEVIVQNDYKILEEKLNELFGMKNATEADRIKVTPASYIGDISSESNSDAYVYLSGNVASPKEAMLAVSYAANSVGDHGVKIYSNPGGQLRQKDLDSSSSENSQGSNGGGNQNESFVEFYESTNKLIDTNNMYRDLVLASENEHVISYITVSEPKRFAVKVKFLEMDARYLDEFNSSINLTGVGTDVAGAFGSQELVPPGISAVGGLNQAASPVAFSQVGGILSRFIRQVDGDGKLTDAPASKAFEVASGNLFNGAFKIGGDAIVNASFNDLLNEGVLRVANEFSLVIHSGERVSLGKGIRFPVPKSNNNVGGQQISVEYIPIGFKGELRVTALDNGLIDAQLASRLSSAEAGAAAQIQGLSIPVFKEEYVNSGVMLKSGQEVVLNAFLTESETTAKATSPLGRIIPFLGKSKRKDKVKNLLFITLEAEEIEQTSKQKLDRREFELPHVNFEKAKNIYSDYARELRAQKISDTVDIKEYNRSKDDALSLGDDYDFEIDPLNMDDEVEKLPGL